MKEPRFALWTVEELMAIPQPDQPWRILDSGIEHRRGYYIPKEHLHDLSKLVHMSGKEWCDMAAFVRIFFQARHHFYPDAYPNERGAQPRQWLTVGRRYDLLQRDGFRCQLCGRSAQSGAVLEIDHRIARALGGTDDDSNLWALCWECNRGKSNKVF